MHCNTFFEEIIFLFLLISNEFQNDFRTTLLQVMLSYSVKSPEFRLSVFLGLIFFIISLMILHFGDSSFLFKLDKCISFFLIISFNLNPKY